MNRVAAAVALLVVASALAFAQPQAPDQQVYEQFREWAGRRPADATEQAKPGGAPDILTLYRAELRSRGLADTEIDRQLRVIEEEGQRLEIERWNRILTSPKPTFNTQPNAFLVQIVRGRMPGTALDVGMGQGRNAIYLAQQGWTVTGFDPAERAVDMARQQAQQLGVKFTTEVVGVEGFDWGRNRWDLIVLSYVGARGLVPSVIESLKPGGLVVVEAFHRDATKTASIGGAVVFDTNELLRLFQPCGSSITKTCPPSRTSDPAILVWSGSPQRSPDRPRPRNESQIRSSTVHMPTVSTTRKRGSWTMTSRVYTTLAAPSIGISGVGRLLPRM